tara:strand:+ start:4047 stop:6800 length:2754 start_codon:yes stop_codon:yes gene_type:complete
MALEKVWDESIEFRKLEGTSSHYSFGTAKVAHWMRFCVRNPSDITLDLVAAIGPALAQELDFYPRNEGRRFRTGNSRAFDTRDIHDPAFHFSLSVPPGEMREYAIRLTAANNAFVTAELWDEVSYEVNKDEVEAGYGVFTGIFLGLLFYNIMLYVSIREAVSLWYIAFALSMFSVLAFFDGRYFQYLLPDQPQLTYSLLMVCYYLVCLTGAMFSRSYLKLEQHRRLDKTGLLLICVFSLAILFAYFTSVRLFLTLCGIFSMAMIAYYAFFSGVYQLLKGSVEARYYLIALSPLTISIFEDGFYNLGIISEHIEPYSPKVGLSATMILLAFGVGRTLFDEKRKAQNEALHQSELANELKSTYSQSLEKEIVERTSEIQAMNADLEYQAEQLIELDNVKSRFFANISHEFRTPLTLIQGPLSNLLDKKDFAEKEVVSKVYAHSKQLQNLIDQLLALSRFDGDSAQLRAEKTNLVDTCRFFVSQFASFADDAGIDLELHSDETNIEAYIDVESFQIVINNLINNALKFTPAGGSIQFDIYADPPKSSDTSAYEDVDEKVDGRLVHITVTDSGMGISETDLPSIFDRYYLGNNQNENQTSQMGSGVGLALVKEVINHHGGQIQVSSVLQVGTRFEITLPLGKEHLHPSEVVEVTRRNFPKSGFKPIHIETSHHESVQPSNKLHKVLVVDDNKDMREYLRGLLEASYEVVEANDGQEAEEVMSLEKPSLVITDLMMPVKDGLEFVKSVKQQPIYALTPIIMLTAKAGRESRIQGLDAAADDYLEKPFDAKELQARVQNLLLKYQFLKTANAEPEVKNEFLVRLSKAANENLSSDSFGVEELAQCMFMSSPTLRRKLAACSSFSPSSFLRQHRLEQAKILIEKGEMRSVAELASAVGFTHTSYFSRLYKTTYGDNPRIGGQFT